MSRKFKITNYAVTFVTTIACTLFAVFFCSNKYALQIKDVVLYYLIGIVVSSLLCALLHELGHLIFGKIAGFRLISFAFWFFKWERMGERLVFNLNFKIEEAGVTSMVKKNNKDIGLGLKRMTYGGLLFSLVSVLISLTAFILDLPYWLHCILACFLPVGAYFLVGNAIPSSEGGLRNDGGVLYGLKKGDDETKVTLNILAIQTELLNGKTFSEIERELYFDLPQLPEDSMTFVSLLNLRYNYYVDTGDFEQAKKVIDRLLSLEEYIPKSMMKVIKADALYNACTFDFNSEKADELMYELEDCLDKDTSATSYRIRLAYINNVSKDEGIIDKFYKRALSKAKKCQLSGLSKYETKLIKSIKD